MELYVSRQLLQLICSAAVGIGIGLIYDIFRILRRCLKADAVFDVMFWLCCLMALFTLGMDIGEGSLHIFMLAFAVLGFAAYMLLLSTPVMTVLYKIAHIVSLALSPLKKIIKIFSEVVKKLFSNIRAWYTMVKNSRKRSKDVQDEENIDSGGTGAHGADRICYPEPDKRSEGFEGRYGADGAASGGDRRGTAGKHRAGGKNAGAGKRRRRGRAGKPAAETDKSG